MTNFNWILFNLFHFNILKILKIFFLFHFVNLKILYFLLLFILFYFILVVVRIDCSHKMSQDEDISLTFSNPLRVNVCFLPTLFKYALEKVHRVCKCNIFRQIVPRGRHSVEKEMCSRLVTWCSLTRELKWMSTACMFFLRY